MTDNTQLVERLKKEMGADKADNSTSKNGRVSDSVFRLLRDVPDFEYVTQEEDQLATLLAGSLLSAFSKRAIITGHLSTGKTTIANLALHYVQALNEDVVLIDARATVNAKIAEIVLADSFDPLAELNAFIESTGNTGAMVAVVTDLYPIASRLATDDSIGILYEVRGSDFDKMAGSPILHSWFTTDTANTATDDTASLLVSLRENTVKRTGLDISDEDIVLAIEKARSHPEYEGDAVVPLALWHKAFQDLLNYHAVSGNQWSETVSFMEEDTQQTLLSAVESQDQLAMEAMLEHLPPGSTISMSRSTLGAMDGGEPESSEREKPEFNSYSAFEEGVRSMVLGQDEALDSILSSLGVSMAGLAIKEKPLYSAIMLGPSGVGKTETALAIAKNLFTEEAPFLRLDMSEYMEKYEYSKLIGASPGLIGSDEDGTLTGFIKKNPYGVVLLDEVEKAHPNIFDILLQILDAGRLTDNQGNTLDCTQLVFLMTTNLGANDLSRQAFGFGDKPREDVKKLAREALRSNFRDEFINRLDDVVTFDILSPDSLRAIAHLHLSRTMERFDSTGYTLRKPTDKVADILVDMSNYRKQGARGIQDSIRKALVVPASKEILKGAKKGQVIRLNAKADKTLSVTFSNR